jgi:NADH:ubiquinone oxidoreductase subunit B-like Fe-S oxidoreductase
VVLPWPPYYSDINHRIYRTWEVTKDRVRNAIAPKLHQNSDFKQSLLQGKNVTDNSRWTEQNFPTWVCCAVELNAEHTRRHDERRLAETCTTNRNRTVDLIL